MFDIGILGGGQLGLMLVQAAHALGLRTVVWADKDDSPALQEADCAVRGLFDDPRIRELFARFTRRAVIEFEHLPNTTLIILAQLGVEVSPLPALLGIAQDRLLEKQLAREQGIPRTPFQHVFSLRCAEGTIRAQRLQELLPGILKTRHGGYDGKMQKRVASWDDLVQAHDELGMVPCILERQVAYECEFSVIVVRSRSGDVRAYPPVLNEHQDGILVRSLYRPGLVPEQVAYAATCGAIRILEQFRWWGILAVEFFLTHSGELLFNEMAPRPHNSGHWTIEGCPGSQFEQLIRAAADWPLESTVPVVAEAEMINLIGDEVNGAADYRRRGYEVHLYGKRMTSPGRKMGHAIRVVPLP